MSETAAKPALKTTSMAPLQSDSGSISQHQPAALLGQLARTMANQLNNIMMALSTAAELELRKAQPSERRGLEAILGQAARATYLIQKLLAFSCRRATSAQPVSLNHLIAEITGGIRELAGDHIEVGTCLDPRVQRVRVDELELEEVLLSLSMEPVADGQRAKLRISTELIVLGPEFLDAAGDACPGDYAVLSVDEVEAGASLPPPQDSSRQLNGSAGQGLKRSVASSAIESIARQAGGLFRIVHSPGQLASFKIYFPALAKEEPDAHHPSLSPRQAPSATILLVEDDEGVRLPAAEFLKMEGFKILQAKTGVEALHIALRHRTTLDLLITDIVMPEMSGHEVAASLLEMYPGLKVLYMSGDPNQHLLGQVVEEAQNTALQKPFSLNTLHQRVKALLGQ